MLWISQLGAILIQVKIHGRMRSAPETAEVAEPADGNVVELLIRKQLIAVTGISAKMGQKISVGQYCFQK